MIAVDTNVLVRLLTGDDPKQTAIARSVFAAQEVWIAKTVLLETEWVLRSVYAFSIDAIQDAFVQVLGLPNVRVEDPAAVAAALNLWRRKIEFADALRLQSRPEGARFVSFDEAFLRRARYAGVAGVTGAAGVE
jgi:predicted nucleic-acid-binding protein